MGLLDLNFAQQEYTFADGQKLAIRGLSIEHITFIVRNNPGIVDAFWKKIQDAQKAGQDGSDLQFQDVASQLINELPEVASQIIACASGDHSPEAIAVARSLAFPIQLELLEMIGQTTLSTEGGLGKLAETVIRVMGGSTRALHQITARA